MKKVLLTGVSGYIGQHCAVELLKNGYEVRGSVRSLSKSNKVTEGIKKVIDPKGNLEYCELNLMKDEGWDEAMEGCDYVLHVASPFVTSEPKDENELDSFYRQVGNIAHCRPIIKKLGVKSTFNL